MIEKRPNLKQMFDAQRTIQAILNGWPDGHVVLDAVQMYNSATSAIVELCEMLQEDTRWKEKVNGSKKMPVYNRVQFIEEFADVCIYLMNVLIYSGTSLEEALAAIADKQEINKERFGV